MDTKSTTITKDEAREAISRSGYILENRIESILDKEEGFYVSANSIYPDPIQTRYFMQRILLC